MKKIADRLRWCSLFAIACFSSASYADVVFSDLGPDQALPSPILNYRNVVGSAQFGGENAPAYSFVASEDANVTQIDLALVNNTSPGVVASLWTAGPGLGTGVYATEGQALAPLQKLGAWNVATTGSGNSLATISGIAGVGLMAGQTYFLQLSPASAYTITGWIPNSIGTSSSLWQCGGSNSTYTACLGYADIGLDSTGAFDILGNPVSAGSSVFSPGGSLSNPYIVTQVTNGVSYISSNIGGSYPKSQFYEFENFVSNGIGISITSQLPMTGTFTFELTTLDGQVVQSVTLDSTNNFSGGFSFGPGTYLVGLIDNNAQDPSFNIAFGSPVSGVPEPSATYLALLGLAMMGAVKRLPVTTTQSSEKRSLTTILS